MLYLHPLIPERMASVIIKGIKAILIDCGNKGIIKRNTIDVINTILNQKLLHFLKNNVVSENTRSGFSQIRLKFIRMTWWSVKKSVNTSKAESKESDRKSIPSMALTKVCDLKTTGRKKHNRNKKLVKAKGVNIRAGAEDGIVKLSTTSSLPSKGTDFPDLAIVDFERLR